MAGATFAQSRTDGNGRVLYDSVRELTSSLASSEVVLRLRDRVLAHLDAEIASVLTFAGPGVLRIASSTGLPDELEASVRLRLGEGISGHVAESGRSLLIRDIERDPRFARPNGSRYRTPSLISVPIAYQGCVRGVVNVNNRRDGAPLTRDDLELVEELAGHAAVALWNAERYEALLERAQHDSLTGLANRGHFWAVARTELARAQRYERPVSLVMLDVDHFKRFNDIRGHLAGDRALECVASTIRDLCRSSDTAARYGGEEFVVILPETSLDGGVRFAEKIRESLDAGATGSGAPDLTISAGVAAFPVHGRTPRRLIRVADRQLYRAKAGGRNRVCFPSDGGLD